MAICPACHGAAIVAIDHAMRIIGCVVRMARSQKIKKLRPRNIDPSIGQKLGRVFDLAGVREDRRFAGMLYGRKFEAPQLESGPGRIAEFDMIHSDSKSASAFRRWRALQNSRLICPYDAW